MAEKLSAVRITELLSRGIAEVVGKEHLRARLTQEETLRLKLGIDPTGARLHLGHAVPLRVLRRFQDLGHTVVLIIGDTTASIGDPSGRNETRPPMTPREIAQNFATYERQALKVLDRQRIEFRWQSEWYGKFGVADVVREASRLSAGWVLSHETFRSRMKKGQPLAFHELLYPLLQAYDSLAVKADVEFGGLDQKFNILTGRELMKAHGMEPQDVVLTKYLVGTDGQKMGKSLGNFIALEEEPFEMFGKIMSLPDTVLRDYFELATDVPMDEIHRMKFTGVAARDAKLRLAETIVGMYHGAALSREARRRWEEFVKGEGGVIEKIVLRKGSGPANLKNLIARALSISLTESQRLLEQKAVLLDGKTESSWNYQIRNLPKGEHRIVVGKKKKTIVVVVQ